MPMTDALPLRAEAVGLRYSGSGGRIVVHYPVRDRLPDAGNSLGRAALRDDGAWGGLR
jgi:hypothetical protein